MSTRKGDAKRKGQKYQNTKAFRNDLHDKSKQAKSLNSLVFGGVCARCKETIEWKVKYQKYKPLTAPRKCVLCQQKAVKQAYYTVCERCAQQQGVCAKCGRGGVDIVESFPQSDSERASAKMEFRFLLKQMTERERRTFLRQQAMGKGRPTSVEGEEVMDGDEQGPLSSSRWEDSCTRSEEGSDQEEGVPGDDGEEEIDGSEGSDVGDSQDRLQSLGAMSNALLEHSGTKNT